MCDPSQLHLSPGTPAASSMWVSWVTKANCSSIVAATTLRDPSDAFSVVGPPPTRYEVKGTPGEQRPSYLYALPYESPYLHHVLLTGLVPGTKYFYRVVSGPTLCGEKHDALVAGGATDPLSAGSGGGGALGQQQGGLDGWQGGDRLSGHGRHLSGEGGAVRSPLYSFRMPPGSSASTLGSRLDGGADGQIAVATTSLGRTSVPSGDAGGGGGGVRGSAETPAAFAPATKTLPASPVVLAADLPPPPLPPPPMRLAIVGDVGSTRDSVATLAAASRWSGGDANLDHRLDQSEPELGTGVEPQALFLVGDLSYADGNGSRWDAWGELVSPFLADLPMVAVPGNHEVEIDGGTGEPFVHWRHRFRMPEVAPEVVAFGKGPGMGVADEASYDFDLAYDFGASFFSFDIGLVHAVCLNTYAPAGPGSAQARWLAKDLKAVDRSRTPWVLAFSHGPWYSSSLVHRGEVATDQARRGLEATLQAHRAAMHFQGHLHAYERTHPAFAGRRDDDAGVTYVTVGAGGNGEGLEDSWANPAPGSRDPRLLLDWVSVRSGAHFGRGDLLVVNRTHLRWQWWLTDGGGGGGGGSGGARPSAAAEAWDEAWVKNPYFLGGFDVSSHQEVGGGGQKGSLPFLDGSVSQVPTRALVAFGAAVGAAAALVVLVLCCCCRRPPTKGGREAAETTAARRHSRPGTGGDNGGSSGGDSSDDDSSRGSDSGNEREDAAAAAAAARARFSTPGRGKSSPRDGGRGGGRGGEGGGTSNEEEAACFTPNPGQLGVNQALQWLSLRRAAREKADPTYRESPAPFPPSSSSFFQTPARHAAGLHRLESGAIGAIGHAVHRGDLHPHDHHAGHAGEHFEHFRDDLDDFDDLGGGGPPLGPSYVAPQARDVLASGRGGKGQQGHHQQGRQQQGHQQGYLQQGGARDVATPLRTPLRTPFVKAAAAPPSASASSLPPRPPTGAGFTAGPSAQQQRGGSGAITALAWAELRRQTPTGRARSGDQMELERLRSAARARTAEDVELEALKDRKLAALRAARARTEKGGAGDNDV